MRKEISYIPIALLLILVASMFTVVPVKAFFYPDGSTDNYYELYGPHLDQMQMLMYGSAAAEWTGMLNGEIDITDWPLTTALYQTFTTDTSGRFMVAYAGGERGFFTVDFNMDPYKIVPNSDRSPYPNPVYIKGTDYVPAYGQDIPPITTNVYFRLGCVNLFNRTLFGQVLGGAGTQILTPVPAYMANIGGGYIWNGTQSFAPPMVPQPFSYVQAEAQFQAARIFQNDTAHPATRFWDLNGDGHAQAIEIAACQIKLLYRQDAYRTQAGQQLATELQYMNFTVTATSVSSTTMYYTAMVAKNYHIATFGWTGIGPDPDYLYDLYNVNAFWDSGTSSCPNTQDLNDSVLNTLSSAIKVAVSQGAYSQAYNNTILWQARFYGIAAQIPLYSSERYVVSSKYYTGGNNGAIVAPDDGENQYRRANVLDPTSRRAWMDFTNEFGFGTNSWFSYVNGYPNCTLYDIPGYPGNNMTIRYGWEVNYMPAHINPFFSEWYWDALVLSAMYDTLGYRDPSTLTDWHADLVKTWTVGTWVDPNTGATKSKVTITLRPDVYWSDGQPMTMADVIFSLVEAGPMMIAKGYSPPWWWPTGEMVQSLSQIDPYTVEILYNVQSTWALGWTLGGFYIVPKHIWYGIINTGNPTAFAPDPNFIGSGPWRLVSYTAVSSVVFTANTVGKTVTAHGDGISGSTPTTSTKGYHNYCPLYVNVHLTSPPYAAKLNIAHPAGVAPTVPSLPVTWEVDLTNRMAPVYGNAPLQVDKQVTITNGTGFVEYDSGILHPTVPASTVDVETFGPETIPKCTHYITVWTNITGPATIDDYGHLNPFIGQVIIVRLQIWMTVVEDIAGIAGFDSGNTPSEVPMPDCKVNILDVSAAAKAFGSYPGHARWTSVADITGLTGVPDYKVNILDISAIAKMFGKW